MTLELGRGTAGVFDFADMVLKPLDCVCLRTCSACRLSELSSNGFDVAKARVGVNDLGDALTTLANGRLMNSISRHHTRGVDDPRL